MSQCHSHPHSGRSYILRIILRTILSISEWFRVVSECSRTLQNTPVRLRTAQKGSGPPRMGQANSEWPLRSITAWSELAGTSLRAFWAVLAHSEPSWSRSGAFWEAANGVRIILRFWEWPPNHSENLITALRTVLRILLLPACDTVCTRTEVRTDLWRRRVRRACRGQTRGKAVYFP